MLEDEEKEVKGEKDKASCNASFTFKSSGTLEKKQEKIFNVLPVLFRTKGRKKCV